jgi:hypothetical protein
MIANHLQREGRLGTDELELKPWSRRRTRGGVATALPVALAVHNCAVVGAWPPGAWPVANG